MYYQEHPELIDEIIDAGSRKAGQVARQTMQEVRAA
jgi:hypothetical protein